MGRTAEYYRTHPKAAEKHRETNRRINKRPDKKAYRRRLARARRERGIMGKGGGDLGHDRNGKLKIVPRSRNRAANGHGNNPRYT